MSEPDVPSSFGAKKTLWPVAVNLLLLLLIIMSAGIDVGALFGFFLALLNGLPGFVLLLTEHRRDAGYAGGFFLSFLLLLLTRIGNMLAFKWRQTTRVAGGSSR